MERTGKMLSVWRQRRGTVACAAAAAAERRIRRFGRLVSLILIVRRDSERRRRGAALLASQWGARCVGRAICVPLRPEELALSHAQI